MASHTQVVIHHLQFQFPSQLEAESTYMAAASGHSTKWLQLLVFKVSSEYKRHAQNSSIYIF